MGILTNLGTCVFVIGYGIGLVSQYRDFRFNAEITFYAEFGLFIFGFLFWISGFAITQNKHRRRVMRRQNAITKKQISGIGKSPLLQFTYPYPENEKMFDELRELLSSMNDVDLQKIWPEIDLDLDEVTDIGETVTPAGS